NAMQRNKLIYALADASLVVSSDLNKGGTWAGAIEQLDKLKFVSVFVRSTGESSAGLDGLRRKGALFWSNPQDVNSFNTIFEAVVPTVKESLQRGLALFSDDQLSDALSVQENSNNSLLSVVAILDDSAAVRAEQTLADVLFASVREAIKQVLKIPMKDTEIATALKVTNAQAKAWLQRLVDDGVLEKQKKPVVYVVKQTRLFE
ncbi:MAG: DNA-processing protein DprA, partial [Sulfuriferula sp.]